MHYTVYAFLAIIIIVVVVVVVVVVVHISHQYLYQGHVSPGHQAISYSLRCLKK